MKDDIGVIHKPCGHGRGVNEMSILPHTPYLVKWSLKGEWGQKYSKNLWIHGCPIAPDSYV